jgi:hypothetical protein
VVAYFLPSNKSMYTVGIEGIGLVNHTIRYPSTLNSDYLLWHTQFIVCAVKY